MPQPYKLPIAPSEISPHCGTSVSREMATQGLGGLLSQHAKRIDHVAIAVPDLEAAVGFYRDVLGMELLARREIQGKKSGMVTAEMGCGPFSIVLVQGTDPASQVSRFIAEFGPGVQHVAIEVDDVAEVSQQLQARGVTFDTGLIQSTGLTQIFSSRDARSGVMFELIERSETQGFAEHNIQSLFEQLEIADSF